MVFESYLKNNLPETQQQVKEILRLDRDDPDALFYLGVVSYLTGKTSRAGRYFNQSLQIDETEKWRWEIERILEKEIK